LLRIRKGPKPLIRQSTDAFDVEPMFVANYCFPDMADSAIIVQRINTVMPHKPTRRGFLKTTATVAVTSALNRGTVAFANESADAAAGTLPQVDAVLRAAVGADDVPGVVAMAATETGVVYEGLLAVGASTKGRQ
jgi:hypothetical protein